MDDDALVRGDGRVAKGRDVALRRATSRRRAGARGDEAGVLDEKVRGDAHGAQRNSKLKTQNSNNDCTSRDCAHCT